MKKTILFSLMLTAVVFAAQAKKEKNPKIAATPVVETFVLANTVDSMSYAFGVSQATQLKNSLPQIPGGKFTVDAFIEAFSAALRGDSTLLDVDAANQYAQNYFATEQQRDADVKKADGEKFLAQNAKRPGVITTASGLQYEILVPADGAKPTAESTVKVHYHGTLLDGTVFDSSVQRGEPIEFPLNRVIPGWTEGVQLMSPGAKYRFYIPYDLAYGERGAGEQIPPYAALIFEVELLEIK